MRTRVRQLRKELLKLNQTEFGRKIGIGQQSVANIENGTNTLTERNFDAICEKFNVNPEWLRHGVGEVFIERKESVLQAIVREFELNPDEATLIAALLELPQEYRAGVVKYVKEAATMFEAQLDDKEKVSRKPDENLSVDEMRAIMNRELDDVAAARERGTSTSSVSIGTSGSSSKRFSGSS